MAVTAKKHVAALDGLRGFAVFIVLLFHLQVPGFSAGFLGVDVFFALSGFLITSLLLAEARRDDRISLPAFWTRRFRRLMPAVVVLLIVVAVVGGLSATSSQRQSLRADLLSTTFYVANWHFINTSDYFSNDGVESPLEHAWSLAIEEQFYVVWPLAVSLLLLGRRKRRADDEQTNARFNTGNRRVAIASTLLVVLSVLLLSGYHAGSVERAYMGTDSRMFEPLAGALAACAIATGRGRRIVDRFGRLFALVGMAGLIAGMVAIAAAPGAYYAGGAVLVTLATLLVVVSIWQDRGTFVGAVLGWRPIVWLGAISYGFYLWHWPFTVWTGVRHATGTNRLLLMGVVVAATLAVSALSYYLIEQPIRSGSLGRKLSPRRMAFAVPVVLLAVTAGSVAATNTVIADEVPLVMMVGDSVPRQLTTTFEEEAEERGWAVVTGAAGGCPVTGEFIITSTGRTLASGDVCEEEIPMRHAKALEADPDVVLWWDRFSIADWKTSDGRHIKAGTEEFWQLRERSLHEHVTKFTADGARVVFVAAEPPGKGIATRCTPQRCHEWIRRQIDDYDTLMTRWNNMLREYARAHPETTQFISITEDVCHDDEVPCNDLVDGVTVRSDGTHYSGVGEELAANLLLDELAPTLSR